MENLRAYLIEAVILASDWMIFKKMGHEGWEGIIPVYNLYILSGELYGKPWKFLLFLVPIYNFYFIFKFSIDLAHSFGKSTAFGFGLVLLAPFFYLYLGFGDSQYRGGAFANVEPDFVSATADRVKSAVMGDKKNDEW